MTVPRTLTQDRLSKGRLVFEAPVAEPPQTGQWPRLVDTLAIQPSVPSLAGHLERPLLEKHVHTMTTSDQLALPVRFIGYAPVSNDTQVFRGVASDCALMPLTRDPLYYASGNKLLIPEAALADLARIHRAHLDFEALFIAHEVPKNSLMPGQAVPLEVLAPPPPPHLSKQLVRVETVNRLFWTAFRGGLRGLAMGAAFAAVLPAAAVGIAGAALIGAASMDPVIFGLNFDRSKTVNGQPLAMWYYLTHWYWPPAQ
jgi:hypothetical protein